MPDSPPPTTQALDPTQVRECHTLGCSRAMLACRFDPTGRYAVAGGMLPEITQYQLAVEGDQIDWSKAGPFLRLSGHRTWVVALAFHPSGTRFFAGDYGGTVAAWDFPSTEAAEPAWRQEGHKGWVRAAAVNPDGSLLATVGNDHRACLWSTADGRLVRELAGHECHVYNVAFHPREQRLITADLKGDLCDWDLAEGKLVRRMHAENMWVQQSNLQLGGIRSLTFHPEGKLFACGGMYGFGSIGDGIGSFGIAQFDWESGKQQEKMLRLAKDQRSFCNGIVFHAAGFTIGLAGGLDMGWLAFWKPGEDVSFHQLKLAQSGWSLDLHPDQRHLAVAHHDNSLRFYDLAPPPAVPAG